MHCLGAFEQRLDEYIGSPRIVGFVFAAAMERLTERISKVYDQDCATVTGAVFHETFGRFFTARDASTCVVRAFKGGHPEQLTEAPVAVQLEPMVTLG